jgi:hypothetical protein
MREERGVRMIVKFSALGSDRIMLQQIDRKKAVREPL